MAARPIFDPDGFKNTEKDGKINGFSFRYKLQYYRGIPLSIVRELTANVDGVEYPREDIRLTVNDETFTLEEIRTVVSSRYRWEYGDYVTVQVLCDGGLAPGRHHIRALQHVAPSYMPFPIKVMCEADFEID